MTRVNAFRNIRIGGGAFVDASGEGGGNIQIQGAQLQLTQKSYIFADTLGAGAGGEVLVRTTEAIALSDGSLITADVVGSGTGGNLKIETGQLIVRDGAQVATRTFGEGQGGNLTITASKSVELIGTADSQAPYGLFEVTSNTVACWLGL
jgi:large exoprotein involved in heme utilization and adhesion